MIGQHIAQYRLTRLLGHGGMGDVFEAIHSETHKRAAIKLLHPEYSKDVDATRRFLNEALAVGVVQHPGLVSVIETGVLPGGAAFLVMELLEGETLGQMLRRTTRIPEREALEISRQIAAALAVAHSKEIVHRDLKPDNIMLVPTPEMPDGWRIKILDFGFAKVAGKHQANAVPTKDGTIIGTPAYMPPEQWMSATMVDPKSDTYSLGVILFEMMAGRGPFDAGNVNALMQHHLYSEPLRLQQACPTASNAAADLVSRMLAKPRHLRPTMQEVCAFIEKQLASGSLAGGSPGRASEGNDGIPVNIIQAAVPALLANHLPSLPSHASDLRQDERGATLFQKPVMRLVPTPAHHPYFNIHPRRKNAATLLLLGMIVLLGLVGWIVLRRGKL